MDYRSWNIHPHSYTHDLCLGMYVFEKIGDLFMAGVWKETTIYIENVSSVLVFDRIKECELYIGQQEKSIKLT